MRIVTKENIDKLAKFIEKAKTDLTTTDYTCSKYDLDSDLAVFVGWSDGYDPDINDGDIHDPKNPTWCLNAGIKIRNDVYWPDYDYLNSPILNDDSGDVCMTDCTISNDEDYRSLARYFLKEYKATREGINKNKILVDF